MLRKIKEVVLPEFGPEFGPEYDDFVQVQELEALSGGWALGTLPNGSEADGTGWERSNGRKDRGRNPFQISLCILPHTS